MPVSFAPPTPDAIPLHFVSPEGRDGFVAGLSRPAQAWVAAQGFAAGPGECLALPGADGAISAGLIGTGNAKSQARGRFLTATAASKLPAGTYAIASGLGGAALQETALGWLLESYRFDRYRNQDAAKALLMAPAGVDSNRLEIIANAEALIRDLINTPASDMGPAELEGAARAVATQYGALITVITGDTLLADN